MRAGRWCWSASASSSSIALSALLGWLYTGVIDFASNPQITGRVSPTMVDLIAALASGAAGAFCMSREDISDSLAGVAIAISLVPAAVRGGPEPAGGPSWDDAAGALLLFVTNFLSILLAGGAVLAILGLSRAANARIAGPARRNAYLAIGVGHADRLCAPRHDGPPGDRQLHWPAAEQGRRGRAGLRAAGYVNEGVAVPGGQRQGRHHGYGPAAVV